MYKKVKIISKVKRSNKSKIHNVKIPANTYSKLFADVGANVQKLSATGAKRGVRSLPMRSVPSRHATGSNISNDHQIVSLQDRFTRQMRYFEKP